MLDDCSINLTFYLYALLLQVIFITYHILYSQHRTNSTLKLRQVFSALHLLMVKGKQKIVFKALWKVDSLVVVLTKAWLTAISNGSHHCNSKYTTVIRCWLHFCVHDWHSVFSSLTNVFTIDRKNFFRIYAMESWIVDILCSVYSIQLVTTNQFYLNFYNLSLLQELIWAH